MTSRSRAISLLAAAMLIGGCGVMSKEDRSEGARLMTEEMKAREEMLARREESLRQQEAVIRDRENIVLSNEASTPKRLIVRLPGNGECLEAVWSGKPTAPVETSAERNALQSLNLISPQESAILARVEPADPTNPIPHLVWRKADCPGS